MEKAKKIASIHQKLQEKIYGITKQFMLRVNDIKTSTDKKNIDDIEPLFSKPLFSAMEVQSQENLSKLLLQRKKIFEEEIHTSDVIVTKLLPQMHSLKSRKSIQKI